MSDELPSRIIDITRANGYVKTCKKCGGRVRVAENPSVFQASNYQEYHYECLACGSLQPEEVKIWRI